MSWISHKLNRKLLNTGGYFLSSAQWQREQCVEYWQQSSKNAINMKDTQGVIITIVICYFLLPCKLRKEGIYCSETAVGRWAREQQEKRWVTFSTLVHCATGGKTRALVASGGRMGNTNPLGILGVQSFSWQASIAWGGMTNVIVSDQTGSLLFFPLSCVVNLSIVTLRWQVIRCTKPVFLVNLQQPASWEGYSAQFVAI